VIAVSGGDGWSWREICSTLPDFLSVMILVLRPGIYLARGLASWISGSGFGLTGLGRLDFQIVYLGAGRRALRNASAGDGAISAEATYQLSDLRLGRLGSLSVSGLTMRACHTQACWSG
jgi:hypothetical protein